MERAARALTQVVVQEWPATMPVVIFAGPGNNGGDALAMARMLSEQNYQVSVYLFNISGQLSPDCAANKQRLQDAKRLKNFIEVSMEFDPPVLDSNTLVIDGLFGSGLNKPLAGGFASLVKYINASQAKVVSIDVPSGLMTEDNTYNVRANIIRATMTLTLQQPKLSFLFPENQQFVGEMHVIDIKLSKEGMAKIEAPFSIIDESDIHACLLDRSPFAHKGQMGTALLIAGSYGMAGAAVLASRACTRSGAGKVVVNTPRRNIPILQASVRAAKRPSLLRPSTPKTFRQ